MPLTEQQVRARADAVSSAMMPLLRGAFYAAKAQGRLLHTPKMFVSDASPKDGDEKGSTELAFKFGSQFSWEEMSDLLGARNSLPSKLIGNPKVNGYQFPDGTTGFTLEVNYEFGGKRYEKSLYDGSPFGTWLNREWQEVIES